jgi:hypothetical protein
MTEPLNILLSAIDVDMRTYRRRASDLFTKQLGSPKQCSRYFYGLLTNTSWLYIDNLKFKEVENSIRSAPATETAVRGSRRSRGEEELRVRTRFRRQIESLPCWACFAPRNTFVSENNLKSQADYVDSLALHIPEIYSEAIKISRDIRRVPADGLPSSLTVAEISVRLEHIAHHSSYCRHTLEILSYEDSWSARQHGTAT